MLNFNFLTGFGVTICLILFIYFLNSFFWNDYEQSSLKFWSYPLEDIYLDINNFDNFSSIIYKNKENLGHDCSMAKCLNLYKCLLDPNRRLRVGIQPIYRFFDKVYYF